MLEKKVRWGNTEYRNDSVMLEGLKKHMNKIKE